MMASSKQALHDMAKSVVGVMLPEYFLLKASRNVFHIQSDFTIFHSCLKVRGDLHRELNKVLSSLGGISIPSN